ncbi:MAG: RNA methyltransferase [Patescibacteria group bacterium]
MQQKRIDRIRKVVENRQPGLIVVFEDIHDPHNAAAILRTCDAMGIQNVWFIFEKEKPYNPKHIGKATSSSANKWLDFQTFTSTSACIRKLKKQGYSIIVTALTDQSISLQDYACTEKKIAVIVGNEHRGVSDEMLQRADTVIKIPMLGFVQSLNVSVATAIILWEITKQRVLSDSPAVLGKREQQKLFKDFIERGSSK